MKILVTLCWVAALAGCATARMVVPPEIAQATEEVPATDRSSASGLFVNESFKLGSYAIEDVDRDWNSGSTASALGFSTTKTAGGYAYKVKAGGASHTGGCTTEAGEKSVSFGAGMGMSRSFAKLGCTCTADGAQVPGKVVISAGNDAKYSGELQTASGSYRITAIYEAQGMISNGEPSGYRVDGDSPRGAVEVLRPGRAWFARGIDAAERDQLACLYAGLMLYLPPKDK